MSVLTSVEKTLLRAGGHKAKWYLSVHHPVTLLSARLNNPTVERGARSIAYDNGGGSGYDSIEDGQTVWVGTALGEKDKGLVRIRAITGNQTSGTITTEENAVDWADNDFLTVPYDYPIRPIWPYISPTGVFKKDGPDGSVYSDQNEKPPPVTIIGSDRVGFMSSGTCSFAFDATDSYGIASGASISSYAWTFSGIGSFNNSASPTPTLTVTTANPNGDWVTCTTTDSNGKTQITRRLVYTHDRTGNNAPYLDFTVTSLSGAWETGGWSLSLSVLGDATLSDFPDDAAITLWHESWYGSTKQFIGGCVTGSLTVGNVLFSGFIRKDTVSRNWDTGEVVFEATTPQALLNKYIMFSISLQGAREPSYWYEYQSDNLTASTALHHLFKWHSTLIERVDLILPMSNTLKMSTCDDFVRASMFSQSSAFAGQHSIFAHLVCNKQGQIHIEEDIQMLGSLARAAKTTVMEIVEADWHGDAVITRQIEKRTGLAQVSGFYCDGYTEATPLISVAPGNVPETEGTDTISVERQILHTQATTNELVGRVLADANNEFPEVQLDFHGHYLGVLDLVPQEWYTLTLAASDTPRGFIWVDQKLVPRSVVGTFNLESGLITARATFSREAQGPDGIAGNYPTTRPDDPEAPKPPRWPVPTVGLSGSLLVWDTTAGVYQRLVGETDWTAVNSGVSSIGVEAGDVSPFWHSSLRGGSYPPYAYKFRVGNGKIYRHLLDTDGKMYWKNITPGTHPPNSRGDIPAPTFADLICVDFQTRPSRDGRQHYFLFEYQNSSLEWCGWLLYTLDDCQTWSWVELVQGTALATGQWCFPTAFLPNWSWYTATFGEPDTRAQTGIIADLQSNNSQSAGATFTWSVAPGRSAAAMIDVMFVLDMGGYIELDSSVVDGGINAEAKPLNCLDSMTYSDNMVREEPCLRLHLFPVSLGLPIPVGLLHAVDYGLPTLRWSTYGGGGYPPFATHNAAMNCTGVNKFRYLALSLKDLTSHQDLGTIQMSFDYIKFYPSVIDTEIRPLGMSISGGDYLYVTTCEGDRLILRRYQFSKDDSPFLYDQADLGPATFAQVAAKTYIAWPFVQRDYDEDVYVFGRMAGPLHVISSSNGGQSFSTIESGWGSDHCCAFHTGYKNGGNRTLTAVKKKSAGPPELHRGINTLAKISDIDLASGIGTRPRGLAVGENAYITVGADTADAVMIVQAVSPYTSWTDITGSYPTTGEVVTLESL